MEKKKHHYISQTYLRGFSAAKAEPFYVASIDLKRKKAIAPSNTAGLGAVRYFNRFDAEGVDPQIIEDSLSEFEGGIRPAIEAIDKTGKFEGEARNTLLNLMAMFSIRIPKSRRMMDGFKEKVLLMMAKTFFTQYDSWEDAKDFIKESGAPISDEESFDYMKDLFERGDCSLKFPREEAICSEFKLLEPQLKRLAERKWSLLRTASPNRGFVTSDAPVVVGWNDPSKVPPFLKNSPGFGVKGTFVYFPLNPNLALFGEYEAEPSCNEVDCAYVSRLNSLLIQDAHDFIYHSGNGFQFMVNGEHILEGSQLLEELSMIESVR